MARVHGRRQDYVIGGWVRGANLQGGPPVLQRSQQQHLSTDFSLIRAKKLFTVLKNFQIFIFNIWHNSFILLNFDFS
jgi:hypothetical protein